MVWTRPSDDGPPRALLLVGPGPVPQTGGVWLSALGLPASDGGWAVALQTRLGRLDGIDEQELERLPEPGAADPGCALQRTTIGPRGVNTEVSDRADVALYERCRDAALHLIADHLTGRGVNERPERSGVLLARRCDGAGQLGIELAPATVGAGVDTAMSVNGVRFGAASSPGPELPLASAAAVATRATVSLIGDDAVELPAATLTWPIEAAFGATPSSPNPPASIVLLLTTLLLPDSVKERWRDGPGWPTMRLGLPA